MTGQEKLLVLADGSERTIQTVRYLAGFMPVDPRIGIVLFHVFSGTPEEFRGFTQDTADAGLAEAIQDHERKARQGVMACLDAARRMLVEAGYSADRVEIRIQQVRQGVARDIVEEAKSGGYSAVVTRRRGLGTIQNLILGSVAVKLLQALGFLPLIFVGQTPPAKKVLLAVDASPASRKAVEFAIPWLAASGCNVCIFHALSGLGSVHFDLPEGPCPQRPCEEEAEASLEAFQAKLAWLFETVRGMLIEGGIRPERITRKLATGVRHHADAIVAEAEEGGFSTVILGRRGLTRTEAFFMGRVSHAVVYGGRRLSVWVV